MERERARERETVRETETGSRWEKRGAVRGAKYPLETPCALETGVDVVLSKKRRPSRTGREVLKSLDWPL